MSDHMSLEVPIMNTVFLCECAHVTRAVILNTETGQKLCAHHRCSVVCMIFMDDDTETHLVMEGKTITLCGSAIANMKNIHRVAILKVYGARDAAKIAHQSLQDEISAMDTMTVVSAEALKRASREPLFTIEARPRMAAARAAARQLGIDALLVARVRFVDESGNSLRQSRIVFGDPLVIAEIEYELIDVATGRSRGRHHTTAKYRGEITEDRSSSTSQPKIVQRLVAKCCQEVAKQMTPHEETVQAPLATVGFSAGCSDLRAGNSLAAQSDWRGAQSRWEAAFSANPALHGALYNMGLAHEAQGQFVFAERKYIQALGMNRDELYENALYRVQAAKRGQQLALAQQAAAARVVRGSGKLGRGHLAPLPPLPR